MKLPQHHLVYEVLRPGRQGKHIPGTRPPQTNGCLTSGDLSPEMDVITFRANTVDCCHEAACCCMNRTGGFWLELRPITLEGNPVFVKF